MANKQTAVEWLMSRFEDGDMYNVEDAQFIKHQALKMERDQINKAFYDGYYQESMYDARSYYDDTYSKDNVK